jgi:hypothetical protein
MFLFAGPLYGDDIEASQHNVHFYIENCILVHKNKNLKECECL